MRAKLRGERAQAILELAFVFPLLLILVLAIIDFGWALRAYVTVTNAGREGARYGVNCRSDDAIKQRVADHSSGLLSTADVTLGSNACGLTGTWPSSISEPDYAVQVNVAYSYQWITPLGGFLNLATGGILPDPLTMRSRTTTRLQ